ncbi:FadR/GntR family transcriptional regulator [Rhodococcus chondri]|uniref:GntR family transcriptional regulator n=1 Tax=Rhodococcus chondri TaxID=3065941 RepID=A0ABU7JUP3_9NOCA|nr:GntR family transcriptional regulator [Rhodococcus sp. CC-R104]MEE2033741.1 GntR family transcriptional regulator [Rhodococcus sp. CC-R104]
MAEESFAAIFDSLDATSSRPIRTPKTAELVALKLRRMIVDGELADGDRLPHEAELMEHFSVSRPTLREAVRVLEAERLVEVRRGSRSGARVCVPGPEIVARPASLLLELSGATVADVLVAREALEPHAARLLALTGTDSDFDELERMVDEDIPASYIANELSEGAAAFHLRLVQLCGNATLALLAGMMHEIFERHVEAVTARKSLEDHEKYEGSYLLLIRSCRRLIKLLRAGDADAAHDHWQQHMTVSRGSLLIGHESTQVRDVLD